MKLLINGYTVTEHVELMKIDKYISHLKKNKKRYMRLVLILAIIVPASTLNAYALAGTTDIGMKAYEMGKYVARAICILGWLTESIKCVLTGTIDGLGKVSIKWISFALLVKFLPSVVDWIFNA